MNDKNDKYTIGDLVIVGSVDDTFSGVAFTQKISRLPPRSRGESFAIVVARRKANPGSYCSYFYKIRFCNEETSDDRWLMSSEIMLIQ